MNYFYWALFLVVQNAMFTFVSRARNSGSYGLHAVAALGSNGVFFAAQFFSVSFILDAIRSQHWEKKVGIVAFYTIFTVLGSVGMHYISKNYIEKNEKRRVGG